MAAPASAQNQAGVPNGSFGDMIAATIAQHLAERGQSAAQADIMSRLPQALIDLPGGQASGSWFTWLHNTGKRLGWGALNPYHGFPPPVAPGEVWGRDVGDNGDFDVGLRGHAGMATCAELQYKPDADGNPMAPALPLAPGLAIVQGEYTWRSLFNISYQWEFASDPDAAALWSIHKMNLGKPKDQWWGVHEYLGGNGNSINWSAGKPAYRDGIGNIVPADFRSAVSVPFNLDHWKNGSQFNSSGTHAYTSKPCPPDQAGGEFDYYSFSSEGNVRSFNTQDGCTLYEKNFALSVSGYAYPEHVVVTGSEAFRNLLNAHRDAALCPIGPNLARLVTDRILYAITQQDGYTGPAYDPVTEDQVRILDVPPRGLAMTVEPAQDSFGGSGGTAAPPPAGEPPAGYTPPDRTPGGNGGGGDGTPPPVDIDLSHPDVPEGDFTAPDIAMPDWIPGIPEFHVPTGSGNCPTFGFSAFGTDYAMSTHCTVIEEHSVTIASIMLVVFSMAAFMIVMRA